jgi:hypothetical protein
MQYVLLAVDHQIISNLLAHEGREDVTPSSPLAEEEAEYSSSSDENSTGMYIDKDSVKEESSEEDELTIRVSTCSWKFPVILQCKFHMGLKLLCKFSKNVRHLKH